MNPLDKTDHRPWPVPQRPWIMKQVWRDLLFAHWPVEASVLRPLIPAELALDMFEGKAWVTIAPFRMDIQPRWLPRASYASLVPELNCRTYVTFDGKPGVYFFSLDITSHLITWGARTFYHLPYFCAGMNVEKRGNSISYSSRRSGAFWRSTYEATGDVSLAAAGTIEHFLTERYCLYAVHRGHIYRGDVHHEPWPLQPAEAQIDENTIGETAGISLQGPPTLLSYTRELEVLIWWPEMIDQPL
jgi:uncharacterized protein YqjF (DUF2071 family)